MKSHRPFKARLERVENGVKSGTPDVHGTSDGVTAWFELKFVKRPKRATTRFFKKNCIRVPQMAWHREYAHHGGRSFILVRDDQHQLYLVPGRELHLVATMSSSFALDRYALHDWKELFLTAFKLLKVKK